MKLKEFSDFFLEEIYKWAKPSFNYRNYIFKIKYPVVNSGKNIPCPDSSTEFTVEWTNPTTGTTGLVNFRNHQTSYRNAVDRYNAYKALYSGLEDVSDHIPDL